MEINSIKNLEIKIKTLIKRSMLIFTFDVFLLFIFLFAKPIFYKEIVMCLSFASYLFFLVLSRKHSALWMELEKIVKLTESERKAAWKGYILGFALPQGASLFLSVSLLISKLSLS